MRQGRRINSGGIRLVYRHNRYGYSRLGLAVSRKYGNAVQRNLLKRTLRDCFRNSDCHDLSVDVLLIPGVNATRMSNAAHDFSKALAMIRQQKERRIS